MAAPIFRRKRLSTNGEERIRNRKHLPTRPRRSGRRFKTWPMATSASHLSSLTASFEPATTCRRNHESPASHPSTSTKRRRRDLQLARATIDWRLDFLVHGLRASDRTNPGIAGELFPCARKRNPALRVVTGFFQDTPGTTISNSSNSMTKQSLSYASAAPAKRRCADEMSNRFFLVAPPRIALPASPPPCRAHPAQRVAKPPRQRAAGECVPLAAWIGGPRTVHAGPMASFTWGLAGRQPGRFAVAIDAAARRFRPPAGWRRRLDSSRHVLLELPQDSGH